MGDRIGQQLGNYRLLHLLGQGGFAEVYLGEHVYLGSHAAIKILYTRVAQDDVAQFQQEARMLANLIHPHIVRVLDFDVDDHTPYLVMDYAPGGTLRTRHPKGTRLSLPTVVAYVKQFTQALQYAHDQKLIHRDIKPENMLIARNGDLLLSDFGIALIAQSSRYQSTQEAIGTVSYMSPEQIQGKPRPASDQYSLGIIVYEWLTGDRPFHGSFTELCAQHMFISPPSLCEKVLTISPDVECVVMTALAKDPKQRFASVQAFATALEQASQPSVSPKEVPPSSQSEQNQLSVSLPKATPLNQSLLPTVLATPTDRTFEQTTKAPPPNLSSQIVDAANTELQVPQPKWSIGKRQMVAMILGIVIYGGLRWIFLHSTDGPMFFTLTLSLDVSDFYTLQFGFIDVLFGLTLSIPFFLGVRFGPWVGLAVAVVGDFLAFHPPYPSTAYSFFSLRYDILVQGVLTPGGFAHVNFSWQWYIASAISGFLPGLALFIAKGRYYTINNISIAFTMSTIAVVIGSIFIAYGFKAQYNVVPFFTVLLFQILSGMGAIITLPILLFACDAIASCRSR